MDLFLRSQRLFAGNLNKKATTYPTFIHVQSQFPDEWYNLIVPSVESAEFDWHQSEQLRQAEAANSYRLSYYVEENKKTYHPELIARGLDEIGDDTYLSLKMDQPFEDRGIVLNEIEATDLETYKHVAQECFPNWNSEDFSQLCFDLAQRNEAEMLYSNQCLKEGNEIVSFGSLIASKKLELGYLHNFGTKPSHRRRGMFSQLTKHVCNLAFDFGVKEVFAIVEENGNSYQGYSKLGFHKVEKFQIYY